MKILFLSPHTDDVELGAGGTLLKMIEQQHEIRWLVFSAAEDSLPAELPKSTLRDEFIAVATDLGLGPELYKVLDYRVRYLFEHRQQVLEHLVAMRNEFVPDLVIGPSLHDFHQDHQVVAQEMFRAFKSTSSIICYELPWNHLAFDTQLFVRLQERHVARKVSLLRHYDSQHRLKRRYFQEEYLRSLAVMRGGQTDADFAEAFEVLRWLL
jgi:N-acetylglucosamine malate deacetylase 1